MPDVFVSYKAEDRRRVEPLVRSLQADGYSVWWDQHIGTGEDWRKTIERELEAARCVIVAWSKRSVGPEGNFVRDEASRAQRRNAYLPVLIDAVQPPLGFGELQATSLRGWKGDRADPRYQAVLGGLRRMIGRAEPQRVAAAQPAVDRRKVLVGGAVATLAIAGGGAWLWLKPGAGDGSDSIAVLPFHDLGGDPAQSAFAAGIAGEIRNSLTRIGGLKVAGSTSSEAVRNEDAQVAAARLGVANILTGSVRQTGSAIRVNAELIDGASGLAKWSQNYDRAPGDIIKIQTDIAGKVVRSLAVALSAAASKALAAETSNVRAQTLAFEARDLSYQLTVPALRQSRQLLDEAISLDGNYARAYALKSFVANQLASRVATTPAELATLRHEALQFASVAVAKASDLPIARSALAFAYALTLQIAKSLREHEVAISLASGDNDVIRNYGYAISSMGRAAEALRYVDEALALDPLNPSSHHAHATALFDARRYEDVIAYARKLKQEDPDLFRFADLLGNALLMLGRTAEGAQTLGVGPANEALVAARTGNRALAVAKLAELRQQNGDMRNESYAQILAQLGDKDAAFAALDRAWTNREAQMIDIKVNPFFDPLRDDARYPALLRKIGLP